MSPITISDQILSALDIEDMTVTQLFRLLKHPRSTVADTVKRLHTTQQVHIGRWQRTRVTPAPIYRLGQGKDAPRPKPLTGAQKTRIYREKHAAKIRIKRAMQQGSDLGPYLQLLQR